MIIAHISDFHLRPDKSDLCISKIKQIRRCIDNNHADIIVYTGDIVDYRYIGTNDGRLKASFDLAEEALKLLTYKRDLDKFIFCPGNHDYTRQEIEKVTECSKAIDESDSSYIEAYQYYDTLLNKLGFSENHYTRKRTICIDGINYNFLIANTNCFRENIYSKDTHNCINCYKVKELAESNTFSVSKENNIFVSHHPLDYVCECGKYKYNGVGANLVEIISNRFSIMLAGDKHCSSSDKHTFIVGNPLYEEESIMAIHEIKELYHTCNYITVNKSSYSTTTDKEISNEIFSLCKFSMSSRVKDIVGIQSNSTFHDTESFFKEDGIDKIHTLEKLFSNIIKFKKYDNTSGEFESLSTFSYSYIANLFEEHQGNNRNILNLKGANESGKSTFLSMLFLFLLFKHTFSSFKYIPLYFNIGPFRMKGLTGRQIQDEFNMFYKKVEILHNKANKPVCLIIDGLNQYQMFGDDKDLGTYFDEKLKYILRDKPEYIVVLSIDTFNQPLDFTKSIFDREGSSWKSSSYLIYFNIIKVIQQKQEQLESMISDISIIKSLENINKDKVIKDLFKENIIDVPLIFLYNNINILGKDRENILYYINSQIIAIKLTTERKIEQAKHIAVQIFHHHKTFHDVFPNDLENIELIRVFEYIKGHTFFAYHLLAQKYVSEIKELVLSSNQKKVKNKSSYLNAVFPQPILYAIRKAFEVNAETKFVKDCINRIANRRISGLDEIGMANLAYFLGGRVDVADQNSFDIIEKCVSRLNQNDNTSRFKHLIFNRTLIISKILVAQDENYKKIVNEYLYELINNGTSRNVNRIFHRMYYQDTYNLMSIIRTYSDEGLSTSWDFYYTYHTLYNRIKESFDRGTKRRLIEIELFTICDLISTRLKHDKNMNNCNTYFYTVSKLDTIKYILEGAVELIEIYLEIYENDISNSQFIGYIKNCKRDFQLFPKHLESNNKKIYFHPSLIINQLNQIKYQDRQGWRIKDHHKFRSMTKDDYLLQSENTSSVENVAEHVYITYLIGLFYLPNALENDDEYNKQTILNIILLHDIGESMTGDCSPYLQEYDNIKSQENDINRSLLSSWMYLEGISFYEQMQLWDLWSNKVVGNENYVIASQLDKLQMIYQYSTLDDKNERFSENRRKEIERMADDITHPVVKKIHQIIVKENDQTTLKEFLSSLSSE